MPKKTTTTKGKRAPRGLKMRLTVQIEDSVLGYEEGIEAWIDNRGRIKLAVGCQVKPLASWRAQGEQIIDQQYPGCTGDQLDVDKVATSLYGVRADGTWGLLEGHEARQRAEEIVAGRQVYHRQQATRRREARVRLAYVLDTLPKLFAPMLKRRAA
jgi:hypothetical protein